jgi:putative ABC transport system permease protein
MLRVAFQGLRGRKGPFAGAFIALAVAAALVMACGTLLQAGLTSQPPVERYSAAPIVVAGEQIATVKPGTDAEDSVPLFERARVRSALADRLASVSGVREAIVDLTVPAELRTPEGPVAGPTGHPTAVHNWETAALTPFLLRDGRAPAASDELVVDAGLARRGGLRVGQRVRLAST